jgi:polyisoprenoid-binding protein YceI
MTVPSTARAIAIPPAGHYHLDPRRSTIAFRTRHMFGLGRVQGSFALRGGELTVADPATGSTVQAEIDTDSFTTGNSARDRVVRSRTYLDTENYPVMRFVSEDLTENGDRWTLIGILSVRETRGPVRLEIDRCAVDSAELRLRATTRIDRTEFAITAQPGMTGRYLDLVLDVVASPQSTKNGGKTPTT